MQLIALKLNKLSQVIDGGTGELFDASEKEQFEALWEIGSTGEHWVNQEEAVRFREYCKKRDAEEAAEEAVAKAKKGGA